MHIHTLKCIQECMLTPAHMLTCEKYTHSHVHTDMSPHHTFSHTNTHVHSTHKKHMQHIQTQTHASVNTHAETSTHVYPCQNRVGCWENPAVGWEILPVSLSTLIPGRALCWMPWLTSKRKGTENTDFTFKLFFSLSACWPPSFQALLSPHHLSALRAASRAL